MASIFRSTLTALLLLLLLPLGIQALPTSGFTVANPHATNIVPDSYIIKYKKTASHDDIRRSQQSTAELFQQLSFRASSSSSSSSPFNLNIFNVSNFFALHVQADTATVRHIVAANPAVVEYVLYDTYVTHAAGEPVRQGGATPSLARISRAQPLPQNAHFKVNNADDDAADADDADADADDADADHNADTGAVFDEADYDYMYDSSAGAGTTVYVIDTGIYVNHPEFGGRARYGYNTIDNNSYAHDDNGHGTNVAGIVGSATYGVAKRAELVAVKVLNATSWGAWSGILRGLQWSADDARRRGRVGRAVVNMSVQSRERADAMNDMVDAVHDAGIPVVVCAGNFNKDASSVSPASAKSAITVGAIDARNDNKADFSNYGAAVDLFAPGVNVVSTSYNGGTSTYSGTSQAAPHVAGIAALLMSSEGLSDPDAIATRIRRLASDTGASVKQNDVGTTNLIANNGFK